MAESLTKGGFTLTPKTGTGNAKVSISCSERTGRVATSPVTFTAKMDGFSVSKSVSVVQEGKPEFVTVNNSAISVDKKGETVTITGVSNTSKLSFSCAADEVTFSSYTANGASATNGVAIAGDPGAFTQYAFSIPVTVSVNTTASSKSYTLNVVAAGGQRTAVVLTQIASTFTYDLTLAASPTSIQAGGGSSTITGKYKTFRNGVLISTEDVTPTCSIPSGTAFTLDGNKISAPSRGTTAGELRSVQVSASYGNASSTITVSQEANTRTLNVRDVVYYPQIGANGSAAIPNIPDYPCYWMYASGANDSIAKSLMSISYSKSWGGGSEYNNATLNESNGYVTADSLGTTAKERTHVLTVNLKFSIDNQSVDNSGSVYQQSNTVEQSTTTGGETIYNPVTAGAISNKTIPASGGSATATAGEGSQSWTINKKYRHDTYTSGSVADVLVEDSKIGTDTIKPSVASISGSAESKGTIKSGITTVKEQAVTWTGNGGKKATGTMYIYQAANAEDYIKYFDPVINSFTVDDIPASGGSISSGSVTYEQARSQYFTSGAYTSLTPLTSGGTITYTKAVSASSLGTTVKDRGSVGTLTVTVTMNDKHTSQGATVYQEANIAIYGAVSVSVTPNPVSIIAAGAIYNIKPTTSQNVGFSSGDSRPGNISLSYAAKNTVTGFSNNGETVTVQPNTTTSPRKGFIVTVTASGEGSRSNSVDVTFNQAAAAAYLNVDPATINIAADATSASFNIKSNDSWTIS